MKKVQVEGKIHIRRTGRSDGSVRGTVGPKCLEALLLTAESAGIHCGDKVRLTIEKLKPEIVFPTGRGWSEPFEGKVGVMCVKYDDGSRRVFCEQSLNGSRRLDGVTGGFWKESLPALLLAAQWANKEGEFKEPN